MWKMTIVPMPRHNLCGDLHTRYDNRDCNKTSLVQTPSAQATDLASYNSIYLESNYSP